MFKMDINSKSSTTNYKIVTMESILDPINLSRARNAVIANKGAPGVDNMSVSELSEYLWENWDEFHERVYSGNYKPSPIRRVYIPKENGQKRPLGIPTVVDRYVQQAVAQVLSYAFEPEFSDNSFGYRRKRGARQAIKRVTNIIKEGYGYVIDLDLSKFFDTVNHSKLLQILSSKIEDGRVISLIHKFLKAPVKEKGKVGPKTQIGTPQGGCISPILANILLNELDQMLDGRGIKFVRYADDMCIFAKSQRAAERILANVTEFIEKKLFLKINEEKTKICKAGREMQFLGFTFGRAHLRTDYKMKVLSPDCTLYPVVTAKKCEKFKVAAKAILSRKAPGGIERTMRRYNRLIRGWHNYYKGALGSGWMRETSKLLRRRIRQLYWKQWKTPENRYLQAKLLCRRPPSRDYRDKEGFAYGSSRYWRISKTKQIHKILGNKKLEKIGWLDLEKLELAHWEQLGAR